MVDLRRLSIATNTSMVLLALSTIMVISASPIAASLSSSNSVSSTLSSIPLPTTTTLQTVTTGTKTTIDASTLALPPAQMAISTSIPHINLTTDFLSLPKMNTSTAILNTTTHLNTTHLPTTTQDKGSSSHFNIVVDALAWAALSTGAKVGIVFAWMGIAFAGLVCLVQLVVIGVKCVLLFRK
ncbi:hypothetical protein MMC30_001602 [Trapelia coarctata]|nr:hypothetical protein [Trapelia coarctata]